MRITAIGLALVAVGACGGGEGGGDGGPPLPAACPSAPILSVAPVDLDDVHTIVPLGNLNPPGHTFPTAHMYFYLDVPPGGSAPVVATLYAPGDLVVAWATASEHVTAGFTDYGITLAPCRDVAIELGHVRSLDPAVFGDVSALEGWTLLSEYATGGETYRLWRKEYYVDVSAGQVLGTAGGRAGQWALDVGARDERITASDVANPARWVDSPYLHAVCPLELYEAGPVLDRMQLLLDRDPVPGDPYPCGRVMQDVPGTAHGCWFVAGTTNTFPEDPHLALVWSNEHPTQGVVSMGTSVAGLSPGARSFTPLASGRRNRPFTEVVPGGPSHGYELGSPPGIVLLEMPDATTLWVEYLPAATSDPATWSFTAARTAFER